MNKKLLSLVLALVMCLGLCVPAFAASEKSTAGTDVQIKEGDLEVTVTNVVGSAVVPVKFWDYVEGKDTVVEEIITIYYISKEVGPDQTYHIKVDSAVGVDQDSEWLGVSAALEFFALKDGAYEAIDGCAMAWDSEVHNGEYLCMAKVNDDCIYFASEAEAPDNISSIPTADPDAKPDETKPEDAKPEEIKPDDAKPDETKPEETTSDDAKPVETTPEETKPVENPFTDVKEGDYFYEPVLWAVEKEITTGTTDTTFTPERDCTVSEILTFLWRAAGSPEAAIENPYTDGTENAWYAGAAIWAHEKGMVTGETFPADEPCTRASTAVYLWQAAGSPEAEKAAEFTDVAADADYAAAVAWAVENAVTTGTSETTFSPDSTCTRGQIATFLYRAFADQQ